MQQKEGAHKNVTYALKLFHFISTYDFIKVHLKHALLSCPDVPLCPSWTWLTGSLTISRLTPPKGGAINTQFAE